MSTILDSLKKSSHSRGDNEKASIDNFNFSNNGHTRKSNLPVLLILLILTAVILYFGYQYLYPSPTDAASIASDNIQTSQEIMADTNPTPNVSETVINNNKINKIEKPNSDKVKKALQNVVNKIQKPAHKESIVNTKPTVTKKPINNFQALNKPPKNTSSVNPKSEEQVKPTHAIDRNVQQQTKTQHITSHTYRLAYQLPFTIRKDLPDLILNIHVYDINPENRIAIINGEKFEVNALISDEVLVKEIVLEGVVLEFKNETFLLPKL